MLHGHYMSLHLELQGPYHRLQYMLFQLGGIFRPSNQENNPNHEIESFQPEEFWTLSINFQNDKKDTITASISQLNGNKIEKFSLFLKSRVVIFFML